MILLLQSSFDVVEPKKWPFSAGAGAKIKKKVELEPKLNNFGSAGHQKIPYSLVKLYAFPCFICFDVGISISKLKHLTALCTSPRKFLASSDCRTDSSLDIWSGSSSNIGFILSPEFNFLEENEVSQKISGQNLQPFNFGSSHLLKNTTSFYFVDIKLLLHS